MSQFGMQMPAGAAQRGPTMNVYTGLLFVAVMALLAACVYVYIQGTAIGPEGNALGVHKYSDTLKAYDIKLKDQTAARP